MNQELVEFLKTEAEKIGISLNDETLQKFKEYAEELIAWNASVNLTAITEPHEIVVKHFLDSLSVSKALPQDATTLIDIGSGAGFPGIPLGLAFPFLTITILEAHNKKCLFLNHIVSRFHLHNVSIVCARAEERGHDSLYREHFDVATARAVAHLPTLCEYTLPFLKIGGVCIAQKTTTDEIGQASHALEILGGTLKDTIAVELPQLEKRILIVLEKREHTPREYPRRNGVPLKKPL